MRIYYVKNNINYDNNFKDATERKVNAKSCIYTIMYVAISNYSNGGSQRKTPSANTFKKLIKIDKIFKRNLQIAKTFPYYCRNVSILLLLSRFR